MSLSFWPLSWSDHAWPQENPEEWWLLTVRNCTFHFCLSSQMRADTHMHAESYSYSYIRLCMKLKKYSESLRLFATDDTVTVPVCLSKIPGQPHFTSELFCWGLSINRNSKDMCHQRNSISLRSSVIMYSSAVSLLWRTGKKWFASREFNSVVREKRQNTNLRYLKSNKSVNVL